MEHMIYNKKLRQLSLFSLRKTILKKDLNVIFRI